MKNPFSTLFSLTLCMVLANSSLLAQNASDALRHSQFGISGSARALGLGGAYSAVGGDLASATLNPAGLAVYRQSTFSITPQFLVSNANSSFLDATDSRQRTQMSVPSWGFTFTGKNYYEVGGQRREVEEGLKTYTFAIGVNQIENYTRTIDVTGFNTESSISDFFSELANAEGRSRDDISPNSLAGLAALTYVVDTLLNEPARYYPAVNGGNVAQTLNLMEQGRRNEIFLSMAGNVEDFLYFGASLGIQTLRYEQTLFFEENDTQNRHEFLQNDPQLPLESPMNRINYENAFTTRGTGINVRLGMIIRPIDQLRIGLSVQSPTYFSLRDQFEVSLAQDYSVILPNGLPGSEELSAAVDPGLFRYSLVTPYKATLGGMFLFGKNGFLSADIEVSDFSSASFSSDDYNYRTENVDIQDLYRTTINYRLGGEIRSGIFRFRAGTALFGDPLAEEAKRYLNYQAAQNGEVLVQSISSGGRFLLTGGFGIRQPKYFFDVTLVNQRQEDVFTPYSTSSTSVFNPAAVTNTVKTSLFVTIGFTI